MTHIVTDGGDPFLDPLEIVERIASANEWRIERRGEEEILVEIPAHWCTYLVYFTWREDVGALHAACCYDLHVPAAARTPVCELIVKANERLWLGHFGLWEEENMPLFRHTLLFDMDHPPGADRFEGLIDIGLNECERFFPAFDAILKGRMTADMALEHALLDPVGEA